MKTIKPKYKVIEESFVNGSQSLQFHGIYNLQDYKIKIFIKRDSYDKQSSAVIYVWQTNTLSWNNVHSIHYSKMAVCKKEQVKQYKRDIVSCYKRFDDLDLDGKLAFHTDKNELMNTAIKILF